MAGGWSANYGQKYGTELSGSRTGGLAVRPAIMGFSPGWGLFVKPDYPPPT